MIEPDDDDWWKRGPGREEDIDEDDPDDAVAEDPVVECPQCGEDVFDDAEQCPACGWWIVGDRRALTGKPNWLILFGFVGVILAIFAWIVWG